MPDPVLVDTARQAAAHYGIPEELFLAQINAESSFVPNPQSNPQWPQAAGGPIGIAQFIPGTAAQYKVDPYDPVQSLWGAAAYDADLYKQKGSWSKVLASYGTTSGNALQTNPAAQVAQNIAQTADTGGTIAPDASGVTGGGTSGMIPSTLPGATQAGGPTAAMGQQSVVPSGTWNYVARGALIFLGAMIMTVGLWALAKGKPVTEVVVQGAKGIRKAA